MSFWSGSVEDLAFCPETLNPGVLRCRKLCWWLICESWARLCCRLQDQEILLNFFWVGRLHFSLYRFFVSECWRHCWSLRSKMLVHERPLRWDQNSTWWYCILLALDSSWTIVDSVSFLRSSTSMKSPLGFYCLSYNLFPIYSFWMVGNSQVQVESMNSSWFYQCLRLFFGSWGTMETSYWPLATGPHRCQRQE